MLLYLTMNPTGSLGLYRVNTHPWVSIFADMPALDCYKSSLFLRSFSTKHGVYS